MLKSIGAGSLHGHFGGFTCAGLRRDTLPGPTSAAGIRQEPIWAIPYHTGPGINIAQTVQLLPMALAKWMDKPRITSPVRAMAPHIPRRYLRLVALLAKDSVNICRLAARSASLVIVISTCRWTTPHHVSGACFCCKILLVVPTGYHED